MKRPEYLSLCAGIVSCISCVLWSALPAAAQERGPYPYGICSHLLGTEFAGRDKAFAMMRTAGIGVVRCDFTWRGVEPKPGKWDFSRTDAIVASAKAAGSTVLPILDYDHPGYPRPDFDEGPWRRYVRAVVERYAADIPAFEVWNEQNLWGKWEKDPAKYAPVLKAAAEEIRAVAPGALVVIGGFGGAPLDYIEALYRLGCGPSFDAMNFHAYWTQPPECGLPGLIENLRALMARHGDGDKPIWMTETGAATAFRYADTDMGIDPFKTQSHSVDEATQASHLSRIPLIAFESGLEVVMPYEMREPYPARFDREGHFGLCRDNFVPKPAWSAYAQFIAMRPAGSVQEKSRWPQGRDGLWCPQWTRPETFDDTCESPLQAREAGAVWAVPALGHRRLTFTSDRMRFFDHLGAELYPTRVEGNAYDVVIGESPVYFVGGFLAGTP